jgi:flagellar protein FlbT
MALRLTLKPHEHVVIGGAAIRNGESRTDLLIENKVPILRERDILSPGKVRTPCERIYLALQLIYVDPERAAEHRRTFESLVGDVLTAAPSLGPQMSEIVDLAGAGRLYQALKSAKSLLRQEKELMSHVSERSAGL